MPSRTSHWFAALAAGTILASACAGEQEPPVTTAPSQPKLVVTLSALVDTVPEATSKPLTVRVTDVTGRLQPASVTWTSTDPTIAAVSAGLISGVTPGNAFVIASAGTSADTALIVVTPNELSVDVQPTAAAVALGDTIQFTATVRTRSGDVVSVNRYTWASSDTAAATIVSGGSVATRKEGEVSISAEALARRGWGRLKIFRSPVASVSITPSTASVVQDNQLQLDVTLRDVWGREVDDEVRWGSTDFTKATVSQEGLVTGLLPGSVLITATSGSRTASATINVLSAPATSLNLVIPSDTALIGVDLVAAATPLGSDGTPVAGRPVAWQSANPAVATVTSAGVIRGVVEGSANISAISDGIVATKRVHVRNRRATQIAISPNAPRVSVGHTSQLSARITDQLGNEMQAPVSWSSANPSVVTVTPTGLASAQSVGSASILASTGSLSTTVLATVENVPVAAVAVSPTSGSLTVGQASAVVATARDDAGAVLTGRAVAWSSLNPGVASVSATGVVTAVSVGSVTIRAAIEGKTADATFQVTAAAPPPVASVNVTLAHSQLNPGGSTQATAVLMDAAGNVLTGRPVTWSSLDTAVAKVSASGAVTAYTGGTVAILARSEGVSGAASLTVATPAPAPVASLTLDVPNQNLTIGESVQSTVVLKDAAGNVLVGRTITYSTDNPLVVSISASGVITGVGAGSTVIRVASGGITAQETMYVASAPATPTVASVSVTAPQGTIIVGQSLQATAVARDGSGNTMSGTTFTWTTSNPSVATVSGSGLITAVGTGAAQISATASGKVGTLPITTTAPTPPLAAVASVTVSLASSSILTGQTSQATAVAKDAQGAVITGRAVTWTVASTTVASVNSSGLVTGAAAGSTQVRATIDGVTNSATINVSAPVIPPPPPAATGAESPRVLLDFTPPAVTGTSRVVNSGGDFQAALNAAQRGDEIVLQAGATFTGTFTLPAKSGTSANGWITIRSSGSGSLPARGTRVTPAHAGAMAKLVTTTYDPALKTAAGASGYWITGIEVVGTLAQPGVQYGILVLGEAGYTQKTLASVPTDLVLDRMYIHGLSTTNTQRCVALNSARTQISDSYLDECHAKGMDSQAIAGWNGPGPFRISNNYLAAAGENIMFGGGDPAISGLVPSDIEIRGNYLVTPISWKGVWQKKNLLELKNAVRVLIEGNVMDGSWSDGQTGWAVITKSANQDGGCRWCRTTDVILRRNLVRNVGAGFNFVAQDDNPNTDTTSRRLVATENVLDVGAQPGDRRGFQILGGVVSVTLERNVLAGNFATAIWVEGGGPCTFKDNVLARGIYGVFATGGYHGMAALNFGCGSGQWSWSNITMVGVPEGTYPSGTSWASSESGSALAASIRAIVQSVTANVVNP